VWTIIALKTAPNTATTARKKRRQSADLIGIGQTTITDIVDQLHTLRAPSQVAQSGVYYAANGRTLRVALTELTLPRQQPVKVPVVKSLVEAMDSQVSTNLLIRKLSIAFALGCLSVLANRLTLFLSTMGEFYWTNADIRGVELLIVTLVSGVLSRWISLPTKPARTLAISLAAFSFVAGLAIALVGRSTGVVAPRPILFLWQSFPFIVIFLYALHRNTE